MKSPGGRRAGVTLAEALVALLLGLATITLVAGAFATGVRSSRELIARSEALEAARTVWFVLDEELRAGRQGRDWAVDASGVLVLRAFRGIATVCDESDSGPGWKMRFRGRRAPDPARDSVLVLGIDGAWRAFGLDDASSAAPCPGSASEPAERWEWSQPDAPPPVLARLFERGSYHLADGAFRYRRGGGGRQPLTPEILGGTSAFRDLGEALGVRLVFGDEEPDRGPGLDWTVRGMDDPE